jgi:hypothetical protein
MLSRLLRTLVVVAALGCAAIGAGGAGPAAAATGARTPMAHVAQAADVVAAVKNQTQRLRRRTLPQLAHLRLDSPADARAALPVLRSVHARLAFAARDVAFASVQSPLQRVARETWVRGTRDEAEGVAAFERAAQAIAAGHKPAARAPLLRAIKLFARGGEQTQRAESLLDLAHNAKLPRLHG